MPARTVKTPEVTSQSTSSTPGVDPVGPDNSVVSGESEREVYLRRAQSVVDESNADAKAGEDQAWLAQNGDNVGVMPDNGVKPDQWKRGLYGKDNQFGYVHGAEATGVDNIDEFRTQITEDLNFNGVFDDYDNSAAFEAAIVAQYGQGDAERQEAVKHIAKNLWAYATTGMDINGNTNVAELQGLLFSLDPMIAEASASNTNHDGSFTIPGSDIELDSAGDDLYGRATMLECRLLASILETPLGQEEEETPLLDLTEEQEETETIETIPNDIPVYDDDEFGRTHFIMDVSSSMYDDHHTMRQFFDEVDFGKTRMGGMTSKFNGTQWHDGGREVEMEEGREVMKGLDRLNFDNGGGTVKKDRAAKISDMFSNLGSGHEESPIATALAMLEGMEQEDIDTVKGEQIVIATDEGDSHPQQMRQLRDLANQKGVLVKVLYLKSGGMMEISINAISDETLEVFEAEIATTPDMEETSRHHRNKAASDYSVANELTYMRTNDNEKSVGDYHVELNWAKLAKMEGIERVEMKDRESRRGNATAVNG